jgi:hypothetical protein
MPDLRLGLCHSKLNMSFSVPVLGSVVTGAGAGAGAVVVPSADALVVVVVVVVVVDEVVSGGVGGGGWLGSGTAGVVGVG